MHTNAQKQTHNLCVIVPGIFTGQTIKGVDTAETDREYFAAQHFRAIQCVALVLQATLCCARLCVVTPFRTGAAPWQIGVRPQY